MRKATASFVLTCTTTGAQTLTIDALTIAAGKTVVVNWGDGSSNSYTGAGARTHAYAGAGVWTVKFTNRNDITSISLSDTKLSGTISAANPLPSGLTSFILQNLLNLVYNVNNSPLPSGLITFNVANIPQLTYNVNANPFPSGLTTLYLSTLPGLAWNITTGAQWPVTALVATMLACPNITVNTWTDNAIRSIRAENAYSQANIDALVNAVWANKANFTYASPVLDLYGLKNHVPSGVYQTASPPTTGMEKIYDLKNGSHTPAGPEWTVTVATYYLSILGDSIAQTQYWVTPVWTGYKIIAGVGSASGFDHAVSGTSVINGMDAQVIEAASDNAQAIIIQFGTNDDNAGNMATLQAEFEENLIELKASNPTATIYVMNVLPRWTNNTIGPEVDKSNIRTAIAAACTAQSVDCWDTYSTPWVTQAQTLDGTHPNAAGSAAIAAAILALLPA